MIYSFILAIIFLGIIIAFPIYTFQFIHYNYRDFENEEYEPHNSLFENIRIDFTSKKFFFVIFLTRRFIFSVMICTLDMLPIYEAGLYNLQSFFALVYLLVWMPFDTFYLNVVEIINEGSVFCCSYVLFLCTDVVLKKEQQYQIGWAIILIIFLNILINLGCMTYINIASICKRLKRKRQSRKLKKYMEIE